MPVHPQLDRPAMNFASVGQHPVNEVVCRNRPVLIFEVGDLQQVRFVIVGARNLHRCLVIFAPLFALVVVRDPEPRDRLEPVDELARMRTLDPVCRFHGADQNVLLNVLLILRVADLEADHAPDHRQAPGDENSDPVNELIPVAGITSRHRVFDDLLVGEF